MRGCWLLFVGLCNACAPDFLSAEEATWAVPLPVVEGARSFIVWSNDRIAAASDEWLLSWTVSNAEPVDFTIAAYRETLDALALKPGDLARAETRRDCDLLDPLVVQSGRMDDSGFSGWMASEQANTDAVLAALVGDASPRCDCPEFEFNTFSFPELEDDQYSSFWSLSWLDPDETALLQTYYGLYALDTSGQLMAIRGCEEDLETSIPLASLGQRHFAAFGETGIEILRVDPLTSTCEVVQPVPSPIEFSSSIWSQTAMTGRRDPLELGLVQVSDSGLDLDVWHYLDGAWRALGRFDPIQSSRRWGPTTTMSPEGLLAVPLVNGAVLLSRPDGTSIAERVFREFGELRWVRHHATLGLYGLSEGGYLFRRVGPSDWSKIFGPVIGGVSASRVAVVEIGRGLGVWAVGEAWYLADGIQCEIPDPFGGDPGRSDAELGGDRRALLGLRTVDGNGGAFVWVHQR